MKIVVPHDRQNGDSLQRRRIPDIEFDPADGIWGWQWQTKSFNHEPFPQTHYRSLSGRKTVCEIRFFYSKIALPSHDGLQPVRRPLIAGPQRNPSRVLNFALVQAKAGSGWSPASGINNLSSIRPGRAQPGAFTAFIPAPRSFERIVRPECHRHFVRSELVNYFDCRSWLCYFFSRLEGP